MVRRLTPAMLAIALLAVGGTLALAVSGGGTNGGNAAITQYETAPPTYGELGLERNRGGGAPEGGERGIVREGGGGVPRKVANDDPGPVETASPDPSSAVSGLPFTGSDVLLLASIGLLLLLLGLAQRRFEVKRRA